jgi:hypothetical protein
VLSLISHEYKLMVAKCDHCACTKLPSKSPHSPHAALTQSEKQELAQAAFRFIIQHSLQRYNFFSRLKDLVLVPTSSRAAYTALVGMVDELRAMRVNTSLAVLKNNRVEKTLENLCSLMLVQPGVAVRRGPDWNTSHDAKDGFDNSDPVGTVVSLEVRSSMHALLRIRRQSH